MNGNGRIAGLRSAVPYLRLFKGTTFVIKVGGEVLNDELAVEGLADQVSLLHQVGIQVVVVHGGGRQASELSSRLGIEVETVHGRRVTCDQTLEVTKMVFAGKVNTELLAALRRCGVPGVGLSGVDGGLISARRRGEVEVADPASGAVRQVDFGWVGDIEEVHPQLVRHLLDGGFVPVVCSLAGDADGAIYNVNADTIAARLAVSLQAEKLILLTGVDGVLADVGDPSSMISHMDLARLEELLAGAAQGGMRPKLDACRTAIDGGVHRTHIISGLRENSLLIEIFTNEGCGTLIERQIQPPPAQLGAPP